MYFYFKCTMCAKSPQTNLKGCYLIFCNIRSLKCFIFKNVIKNDYYLKFIMWEERHYNNHMIPVPYTCSHSYNIVHTPKNEANHKFINCFNF